MKIIGEKINGTRKSVARAIEGRDADFIQDLARRQAEAGSTWLDVNAGTHPDKELEDLVWLVETVQSVVDVPLCLDSANPRALEAGLAVVDRTPLINSISGEPDRLAGILPLVAEHDCPVIALAMDEKKIPESSEQRLAVIRRVMAETRAAGVPDDHVYVDPLVMTIATNVESAQITLDTIRGVRREYPEAHMTLGLSNVSFGLPKRTRVNQGFVILALEAGLDTAILDPLDDEMRAAILVGELLLGRDRHCLNYVRASRKGILD